jgi:hypothetical protein
MKEFASITVENSDGVPKMRRKMGESFEVGVLISGGFGAGWSTWTPEYSSVLLFHKDIVEFIVDNPPQTCVDAEIWDKKLEALVQGLTDDDCVYMGGAEDLEVVWLPEGTPFLVTEYDGSESLRTLEGHEWHKA